MYYVDEDEVFWSEEIYNLLGVKSKSSLKKLEDFYRFVHPEDLEKVVKSISNSFQGREFDIEFRIINNNGDIKFLREKVKVILEENKVQKIVGIIQDLTENMAVKENLKFFSRDLIDLQRILGIGAWRYSFKEKKFYYTNEVFSILNIEQKDLGNNYEMLLELIHPQDKAIVKGAIKNYVAGDAIDIEFRILENDGTYKYVKAKGEPQYDKNGELVELFGILQDITDSKVLEEKINTVNDIALKVENLAHVGSWQMNLENKELILSKEAMKIYGINPVKFDNSYEEFLKRVHPEDQHIFNDILDNPPNNPCSLEYRFLKPDGSISYIYHRIDFIFNEKNKPVFVYGVIHDITEYKELKSKLKEEHIERIKLEKKYETLIQGSNDVFEILDKDGTTIYVSDAVERVIGYTVKEKLGRKPWEFFDGKEAENVKNIVLMSLSSPNKRIIENFPLKRKDGQKVHIEVSIQNLLNNSSIEGIVLSYRDITKTIETEKKMSFMSTHDKLTGLPNNIFFMKKLRQQCEYANENKKPFALMMLYIDGIKDIAYSFGYETEEQLLINAVERIKDYLGEETFISRYHDDLFAIIVHGMKDLGDYETIGKGIIKQFMYPFKVESYDFDLGVNLGISIYPKDAEGYESLIRNANLALIRAKKEGKNVQRFYSSDLDIKSYREFILKSDLHRAISENQLRIYYQPIVRLNDNNILAAEALLRWNHPEWGIIFPSDFIHLAEETRLIIDIERWTLKEVCKNYCEWIKNGLPSIKVSVNFSPIQFYEENFVDDILDIINQYELNPDFLIIEITESTFLKNQDTIIKNLKKLKSHGIQIAIDNIGKGYSSLLYLSSFNVDIVKIDKSFTGNISLNENNKSIIKLIVNVARELKIKLVAEGIETVEELLYLKSINCYTGQGFIFSKPLEVEDFEKLLKEGNVKSVLFKDLANVPFAERRKFFRINFLQLLEGDLTVQEIRGKKINVGNTKILIKNLGPGGLCFISNIRFPVEKDIVLQFTTELVGKELKVYGYPVWSKEIKSNLYEYGIKLYEYGVEFSVDENERMELIRELNKVQIKMKKNELFGEGRFISGTYVQYFADLNKNMNEKRLSNS
ncbi:MAG TPA: EAL domain-containing protein [Tissierellaceae bacterium]